MQFSKPFKLAEYRKSKWTLRVWHLLLLRSYPPLVDHLIQLFASVAAILALTPLPTSDIIPLAALNSFMVYNIARLRGIQSQGTATTSSTQPNNSELSIPNDGSTWQPIRRFMSIVGLVGVVGLGSRYAFSQFLKVLPGF